MGISMNRDIKFRAWDGSKMVTPEFVDANGHAFFRDEEGKERYAYKDKVMQFIGIKDVNDVEVYEGDLVKGMVDQVIGDPIEVTGEVHYSDNTTCWMVDFPHLGQGIAIQAFDFEDDFTVVGNIFATPQLLTEQDEIM